jgi:two-component system chemotaxis response regulator CheB
VVASIRVLIIDASPTTRQIVTDLLEADPSIQVMGTAADPFLAAKRIEKEVPDVILLDFDLPRMNGMIFLKKLMSQCPLPVIMFSDQMDKHSPITREALDAGAVACLLKPTTGLREFLLDSGPMLCGAIKTAGRTKVRVGGPSKHAQPKLSADAVLPPPQKWTIEIKTEKVICLGASTGGTESLRVVLESLPADSPGVVIVQHMPEGFTNSFAQRLNSVCNLSVKEAQEGDEVMAGLVLIAPGNRHMLLQRRGTRYIVELKDGPLVSRHRPSVDVLFRSAARAAGPNAIGVIMTGMGDDGAQGLLEMKSAGAETIAEHESSCVVYGMPKEAIAKGAALAVVPLNKISQEICRLVGKQKP